MGVVNANLKHAHSWRYNDHLLTSGSEAAVNVMVLEH